VADTTGVATKKNQGLAVWDPAFLRKVTGAPAKGTTTPFTPTLPPPPPGTYDPSIDYESGAANRGYQYTQNDAATQFETGTEQHNATLADLLRQEGDVRQGYTRLGHQQADAAAAHGITSAGLLALSADKRATNQAHDLVPLTAAENAENSSYAHTFGGYNGQTMTDPYTGQPVVGSLVTQLGRAGIENTAYQTGLSGQKVYQAQQGGYVAPSVQTNALGVTRSQASAFARRQQKAKGKK
jgi:hypothetical protein